MGHPGIERQQKQSGNTIVRWEAFELVISNIIVETDFSQSYGFTEAFCWWASTTLRQAKKLAFPPGCRCPLVLRSHDDKSCIRDFCFVDGIMKRGKARFGANCGKYLVIWRLGGVLLVW